MTVLIDSWAWIEYFQGSAFGKRAAARIDGDEDALVSSINIAEVFRWVLKHEGLGKAEEKRREIVRRCAVRDFTLALAVEAAKLRHARGWGLGDAAVYATAMAAGARLLTGDSDFENVPEVDFIGKPTKQ